MSNACGLQRSHPAPLHCLWRALLHCPVGQGTMGIARDVLTLACFISRRILKLCSPSSVWVTQLH